jgi:hypothetical protein
VPQGERLTDESAHRPPKYACALQVEYFDYSRRIIGEFGDIKGLSAVGGATDSTVVEENELIGNSEPVDKRRIPVCTGRGKTIQNQEWSALPYSTIGDLRPIDWDRR